MNTESTTSPPARMTGRQVVTLVVLLASQFLIAADFSIINVSLPKVGAELEFAAPDLHWIATTFAVCAAGCTLAFGRIGDFVGRRRVFTIGMAVLVVASLIGGMARSAEVLLIARVLQGLANAAILPASLALLTTSFTEPTFRARALGLNSVMMSSGFIAGSILGGMLADLLSWRWAFFVNVPVALAAVLAIPLLIPESRSDEHGRIDFPGAVLITSGMFALVLGVSHAAETGISLFSLAAVAAAVVLLTLFWGVEKRTDDALVPVDIFRLPDIAWSNVAGVLIFAGETSLIFMTGLYVQEVLGLSPLGAGLVLLGIGVGQTLVGACGHRLLAIIPARTVLGFAIIGQGMLIIPMLWMSADPGWLVPLVATQFANGCFSMLAALSFMLIATSAVDVDRQGMAAGMATQSQQVGMAIGIPLLSSVLTVALSGAELGAEQLGAIQVAVGVDAAVLIVVGVVVGIALRRSSEGKQDQSYPVAVAR